MEISAELILGVIVVLIILIRQMIILIRYDKVEGICVDVEMKKCYGKGLERRNSKSTYSYVYNGCRYETEEKVYFGSEKRKKGDECNLYVDKVNPSKCVTPAENIMVRYFLILGILLLVIGMLKLNP